MGNENKKYLIKDAARILFIEPHVLRYWEEELGISIERNELGHRYYTGEDISLLKEVKALKESGMTLKAIKNIIEGSNAGKRNINDNISDTHYDEMQQDRAGSEAAAALMVATDSDTDGGVVEFKTAQIQSVMNRVMANAMRNGLGDMIKEAVEKSIRENVNSAVGEALNRNLRAQVSEAVIKQMDVVAREQEERAEERFRRIDIMLRDIQNGKMKKKRRLFKK